MANDSYFQFDGDNMIKYNICNPQKINGYCRSGGEMLLKTTRDFFTHICIRVR